LITCQPKLGSGFLTQDKKTSTRRREAMKKKSRNLFLLAAGLLTILAILLVACEGTSNGPSWSDDPDATPLSGGGSGPADEPEEPEEPEDDNGEAGDDIDLVPLVPACASRQTDLFAFAIAYQSVTWFGPPTVKIGPGGFADVIGYTYDEDTNGGVFQMISSGQREMPIEVTFPDCRSDTFNTSVKFQARAEGTCKDDQVSLTVYEIWDSVSVDIPCEANSDVCGDDEPCTYPLILPFAFAGEQGITIEYQLDPMTGNIIDGEKDLPFMGVGATGSKTYTLSR
jgi:hypothetical protein